MMEQALKDIRNKAKEKAKKFGELSQYEVSCLTIIALIDRIEELEENSSSKTLDKTCN